jgi:hypothetical protein
LQSAVLSRTFRVLKGAVRSVHDPLTRAAWYWERAVECLHAADASGQDDLKAEYRRLAEHYAMLADGEQKIAAYLRRIAAADGRVAKHTRGPRRSKPRATTRLQ